MKRFLLVSTLCIAAVVGSVDRASAQYPGYGYGIPYSSYYSSYGGLQLNVAIPTNYQYQGYNNYQGYNPYYGPGASYPTLLNPDYVVGNYRVLIVPYRSPNIYAPLRYEYKPYPPR